MSRLGNPYGLAPNSEGSRIYNWCHRNQPNNMLGCCLSQVVKPAPKPGKMKAVFLLELSAGLVQSTDNCYKNTLNYYWNTYPQEFTKCPIVDTAGSLDKTISLLTEYYGYGFRYFCGFTSSNILTGVLGWFNLHPDATGFTIFGNVNSLSVPKSVYRFKPSNSYRITSIQDKITSAYEAGGNIYYIYQTELIGCHESLVQLEDMVPPSQLFSYPGTSSNLTIDEITSFLLGYPPASIIVVFLNLSRDIYINCYNGTLIFDGIQYDVMAMQLPEIVGEAATKLTNQYYAITFNGLDSSILWRNGFHALGQTNFEVSAPNVLQILNQFANNESIENTNSHYGVLKFDPVTKDIMHPTFLIQVFNGTTFVNTYLHIEDPYLGTYNATFLNSPVVSSAIIPVSKNNKFTGKAIALLDLNYSTQLDTVVQESLHYYWFKDPSLSKFPITDISGLTSLQVANLLTTYFDQGYRVFIGPNFGYTLDTSDVLNWFTDHPTTTCISIFSGVTIPTIPPNIYRLNYEQTQIISIYIPIINASSSVYFVGDNDQLGNSIKNFLYGYCAYIGKPYSSLTITDPTTQLTSSNVQTFLTGNTTTSIVVIIMNVNLNNYLGCYDPSLTPNLNDTTYASQYIGTNNLGTIIPIGATALDHKLYIVNPTQANTSFLWNENRLYLSNKYSADVISFGTISALRMTDYILKGKDVSLLGSDLGVLQFSKDLSKPSLYNNILFPSTLLTRYQTSTNTFANFKIVIQDPLLGNFEASFV